MADNGAPSDAKSLVLSSSPQNHGRRKKSEEDSSSKSSRSDLEEGLLMEILQRLPAAKDAFVCSSVCKNWYETIFSPHFISRFVTYHVNHVANKNDSSCNFGGFENSISVVTMSGNSRHRAIMLPLNPHSKIQPLNLRSFCPKSKWACTLASCHDLLLCVASMKEEFKFYICNPLTMQAIRVSVPEWEKSFSWIRDSPFAFVSEPYCSRDSHGGCILNAGFRYRMLCVRADKLSEAGYLPIEIYSSGRGESSEDGFIEDSLFGEEFQKKICSNVVVCNGKVHWCNGESIVAYDPFRRGVDDTEDNDIEEDGFIIKCPDCVRDMTYTGASYELGVYRGHLRLMHLELDDVLSTLRVWDLEDYEKSKWSAERKFYLVAWIFSLVSDGHPLYQKVVDCFNHGKFTVVALHSCDEDAVCFNFGGVIILWNMESKELNVLAEFPGGWSIWNRSGIETLGNSIVIPWWPTPIGNSVA